MKVLPTQSFTTQLTILLILLLAQQLVLVLPSTVLAAKEESHRLVYLQSDDLTRVLDYKEELEGLFDAEIAEKFNVVGVQGGYALIYNGASSLPVLTRTMVGHAEILRKAGYDEPYTRRDQEFHTLYNVSYGMGPNLEPLKKRYELLVSYLGEDVGRELYIEQTRYGNYTLIYRYRGDKGATTRIARAHGKLLRAKKISSSLTKENNNTVVYGQSSLIDDADAGEVVDEANGDSTESVVRLAANSKVVKIPETPLQTVTGGGGKFDKLIEDYIAGMRRNGQINGDESTGWMVYDLEKDINLVSINAEQQFQAASMIKPFIALAFFHLVREGKLAYGPKSKRQLESMIQRSSNPATNWAIRQVGGPAACDAILKEHYSNLFHQTEIKEYIPAGGRTYVNSASPADYVRFLRALWNKDLPYGKEIRRMMALPKRDRLSYGTKIPRSTLVYNKTGSTAHLCGDMGILVPKTRNGGRYPYAIVGVIETRSRASDYGQWMGSRGKIIRQVSTLVYQELKKENKLL